MPLTIEQLNALLEGADPREVMAAKGTWTTKDGRVIPVKDMTDQHIVNVIRYCYRTVSPYEYDGCDFAEEVPDIVNVALEMRRRHLHTVLPKDIRQFYQEILYFSKGGFGEE